MSESVIDLIRDEVECSVGASQSKQWAMLLDGLDKAVIAERDVMRKALEQSEKHVRKLTSMLNRACHIGLYEADLTIMNSRDELNDYLDYIQDNSLLDW